MKKYSISLLILFISIIFCFTGCKAKKEGQEVAKHFYEAIKEGDFPKAIDLCHPKLFEITSREEMMQILSNAYTHLGVLKSFTQTSWNAQVRNGTSKVELTFEVVYEKGRTNEKIILYKDSGEKDMKVLMYKYEQQ